MNYLVDTNVISEVRKGNRGNSRVISWWNSIQTSQIYLSVLTLGELQRGVLALRQKNKTQAQHLENWIVGLNRNFASRLVSIDKDAAMIWARISGLRTFPLIDSLMAASAISRKMTFVTRNTGDIKDCGVLYLNPFEN